MHPTPRRLAPITIAALIATIGCSSATTIRKAPVRTAFFHVEHRLEYGLSFEDLRRLDWYVDKNVIVTGVGEERGAGGTARLQALRAGLLVEAGPKWLRVSFDKGPGAYFSTGGSREDGLYYLASPVGEPAEDGTLELTMVKDDPERSLRVGDETYTVIEGADTYLRVGQSELRQLQRNRNVGRPKEEKK